MLLVGTMETKKQAQQLSNYLSNLDIETQLQQHGGSYEVWVIDGQHLVAAKQAFQAFVESPDDPKYQVKAKVKKDDTAALKASYRRHFKRPHGNGITITLLVLTIVVFLLQRSQFHQLTYSLFIANPSFPILPQWLTQPWRLLTPMLLHFSLIHILFNAYWLYYLGSLIETKESRLFYLLLIIVCDLASNLLQLAFVGPLFGGLSGVVYGLFGFLWVSSRYYPWSGYYVRSDIVFWMIGWLVIGFTGYLGPVANFGHLGGFILGSLFAVVKQRR
jgi:GlpG protein